MRPQKDFVALSIDAVAVRAVENQDENQQKDLLDVE